MSTATATETKPFRLFSPLRTYLFCSALLVFLATSPFTVGKGVARFCDFIANTCSNFGDTVSAAYATLVLWNLHVPLESSFITAGVGFIFVSILLLLKRNNWRGWYLWLPLVLVGAVNELLVFPLSSPPALYDAFGAAGGTPEWLNFIASCILTGCAWFASVWIIGSVIIGFLTMLGMVIEHLEGAR
ncbi:hypothetical protein AB4Y45_33905 [Paraburkholderia sp. EG287A]|uniref:hypothetical protein n=1 Tax=Paraburkholderia sp. EG287A TaxID=3237012 RepID=UPI0034D37F34